jgi:hypothetical protein
MGMFDESVKLLTDFGLELYYFLFYLFVYFQGLEPLELCFQPFLLWLF